MKPSTLRLNSRRVIPICLLLAIVLILAWYLHRPILYFIVNSTLFWPAERDCETAPKDSFCKIRYDDGGFFVYQVSPTQNPACCIVERIRIEDRLLEFRARACLKGGHATLNCRMPSTWAWSGRLAGIETNGKVVSFDRAYEGTVDFWNYLGWRSNGRATQ